MILICGHSLERFRLLAPNLDATYLALKPEFDRFLAGILGPGSYSLDHRGEPRELFCVGVKRNAQN